MSEQQTIIDEHQQLQQATERAENAERELAQLKAKQTNTAQPSETSPTEGVAELRHDSMMAHLLDALEQGQDIGHYGRLVFAMVARHFMAHEDVLAWLMRDPDFQQADALTMLRQVEGKDYNPPRRERILAWQAEQSFPILPHPEDPDCGNLYRNLKFPDGVYEHIGHYQEQKAGSA